MEAPSRPIFLLTDFGQRDAFVFQVKATIAAIAPASPISDISHEVEPGAIDEGAWFLETNLSFLPAEAVVVAVVDPGVGTARRAAAVAGADGRLFVGPDNGLLSAVLPGELRPAPGSSVGEVALAGSGTVAHELVESRYWRVPEPSATFHGRDIFAPAGAYLALRTDIARLGPALPSLLALPRFEAVPSSPGRLRGSVVHVDHYGNLITTVPRGALRPGLVIGIAGREISQSGATFAAAVPGELIIYPDSSGFIGIACNGGSAAAVLGVRRGAEIEVTFPV